MAKRKSPSKVPLPPLPIRIYRLHAKLAIAGLLVTLASFVVDMDVLARLLTGWDIGLAIYLTLTLSMMWHADVAQIRKRAAAEDEGAFAILLLSIAATFASLVAIVFALEGSKQGITATAVILVVATILLSWTFVHTIFSFHYAHEYYGERRDGKLGGLVFPGSAEPDYRDFLYFSLVIGMTSQVSDVPITSKVIRRMAAAHGVLSFFLISSCWR